MVNLKFCISISKIIEEGFPAIRFYCYSHTILWIYDDPQQRDKEYRILCNNYSIDINVLKQG